ncbi:MAG TPA: GIY-YIG nuclease family protein [Candidatus Sulfotelmatobacter sp.]|nr:GIY-YIG nuclease family protein [Candidatus Sulfotelmatobacter sp.]
MTKEHILSEIRRTAKEHGDVPLGHRQFEAETGIRYYDWFGKHWGRWGDAVKEAGFAPNTLQDAFTDDSLVEKLIAFIRELRRFPGTGDLRLKKRSDATFPNDKVFRNHFGSVARVKEAIVEYCRTHPGFDDVPALCGPIASNGDQPSADEEAASAPDVVGFVYLIKHGKHYKIGKTNAIGRREYELAIQLPEKLRTLHIIKTDDPDGIEEYWHKRFAAKRGNGEWFELGPADVQAFKRRKFM